MDILQKKLRDNLEPGYVYNSALLQMIRDYGTRFAVKRWLFNHTIRHYYGLKIWFKYRVLRPMGLY